MNPVYKIPDKFADISGVGAVSVDAGWKAAEILNSATSTGNITVAFSGTTKTRTIRPGEMIAMSFDGDGGKAFTITPAAGCIGGYTVLN